ncbi:MAG: hypothetical protein QOF92_4134 [Pseudonocardiales bacterium]|nr:hypothetical protein [Pseudonocardiales bacterium]
MHNQGLVVALSLLAALAFASSSVLKHASAGHAPDAQNLHPGRLARFIVATLAHPLWLFAIACDVAGLALQIIALHLGALAIVQPLLISGLLFALILRRLQSHHHVARRQLGWALVLAGALGAFLALAAPAVPATNGEGADRLPAVTAAITGAALALVCIGLGRRQRSRGRAAALLGIAVGVIYAATAALLKAQTDIVAAHGLLHLLVSWQLYVVVVVGAAGLLLNQLAFQAGPIAAGLAATAAIDPLLSIVIGVLIYDERLSRGPGGGVVLVGLVLTLGLAVVQLARTTDETAVAGEDNVARSPSRPEEG